MKSLGERRFLGFCKAILEKSITNSSSTDSKESANAAGATERVGGAEEFWIDLYGWAATPASIHSSNNLRMPMMRSIQYRSVLNSDIILHSDHI
ncbi:hypothetical protein ONZ45_g11620 [Pleurotus djamor]|nr:hypothetical protein ONZ45_g11620 [Pleurotus djamor]